MKSTIAIDLGGTKIEILLSHDQLVTIEERKRVTCDQFNGYKTLVQQISLLIKDALAKCKNGAVIGMGIPGTINPETGLVKNSNIQAIINQPFKKDLEQIVGQPVFIENDGLCFTLSESILGSGKEYDTVLGLILGTGIGGGLVFNKKPYPGKTGIACEVGHMTIQYDGLPCWCGRKGCLEAYASGTATQKRYKKETGQEKKLTAIYEAATQKMEPDFSIIKQSHFFLGQGLANLIMIVDPDIVVVGGGISNQQSLLPALIEQTRLNLFNQSLETPIVLNQKGDSSGIFGAGVLAQVNL